MLFVDMRGAVFDAWHVLFTERTNCLSSAKGLGALSRQRLIVDKRAASSTWDVVARLGRGAHRHRSLGRPCSTMLSVAM